MSVDTETVREWARELIAAYEHEPEPRPHVVVNYEISKAYLAALARVDALTEAAREVLHEYDLWAEDANDGEFAIWSRDRFMGAFVHLRKVLAAV